MTVRFPLFDFVAAVCPEIYFAGALEGFYFGLWPLAVMTRQDTVIGDRFVQLLQRIVLIPCVPGKLVDDGAAR